MNKLFPWIALFAIMLVGYTPCQAQLGKLKQKVMKTKIPDALSHKAKNTINQIDRLITRADKAYESKDRYDLTKQIKYLKKNRDMLKKAAPSYSTDEIDKAISKYEDKLNELPQEAKPASGAAALKTPARAAEVAKSPRPRLDFSTSKLSPTILMHSILYEYGLQIELDGTLNARQFKIGFLPSATADGQKANYSGQTKDDIYLTADVVDVKSGAVKNTFHYTVNPVNPPFSLMTYERSEYLGYTPAVKLTEGAYEMRFKVDEKHIYTYPFRVIKKSNNDPYAAMSDIYFIEGAWRDWGYFEENSSGYPVFNYYVLNDDTNVKNVHRPNESIDFTCRTKLYRNGQYVGAGSQDDAGKNDMTVKSTPRGVWTSIGSAFYKYPKGGRKEMMKTADYKDGSYYVLVEMKDVHGKNVTTKYPFSVKNGKFVPAAQADRSKHKDTLTLIEQGPTQTWIKAQK